MKKASFDFTSKTNLKMGRMEDKPVAIANLLEGWFRRRGQKWYTGTF